MVDWSEWPVKARAARFRVKFLSRLLNFLSHPSEDHLNTGFYLFKVERLGDVIISPILDTPYFLGSFDKSRHHNDRYLSGYWIAFQPLANLVTVHSG